LKHRSRATQPQLPLAKCPHCGAGLGPWEDRSGCITCNGYKPTSVADRAVAVLEKSKRPIAHWDVKRALDRRSAQPVNEKTLLAQLGSDRRACWSGSGIYGLYRHGLLPGARDLTAVGSILSYSSEEPLLIEELCFVARYVGYSFADASLSTALARFAGPIKQDSSGRWSGERNDPAAERYMAALLELKPGPQFLVIKNRAASQVRAGLRELVRRLGKRPAPLLWPPAPSCKYFADDPARIKRVQRRAVSVVEGLPVQPYVARIPERDAYLEGCIQTYARFLGRY
jgi:hypothetical protein